MRMHSTSCELFAAYIAANAPVFLVHPHAVFRGSALRLPRSQEDADRVGNRRALNGRGYSCSSDPRSVELASGFDFYRTPSLSDVTQITAVMILYA